MSIILLLILMLQGDLSVTITLEDLDKLFQYENCVQGSLSIMDQTPGIETTKWSVVQAVSVPSISEGELALYNISTVQDKTSMSKLRELAQYNKIDCVYKLIERTGPPHDETFRVQLFLGEETYEAEGKSKKGAQKSAASIALQVTKYKPKPLVEENKINLLTPTVKLNNIATKLGMAVSYTVVDRIQAQDFAFKQVDIDPGKSYLQKLNESLFNTDSGQVPIESNMGGPYSVKVNVDTMEFYGFGNSLQDARHDAALKAIDYLTSQAVNKINPCTQEGYEDDCHKLKEGIKSPISKVYEAGYVHKIDVSFDIISETGPPHKRVFVTQCKLGEFATEGEGFSKKESKKLAAEKMLANLAGLPEITYDTNRIVNALKKKNKKKKKRKNLVEQLDDNSSEDNSLVGDVIDAALNMFTYSSEKVIPNDDNSGQHMEDVSPKMSNSEMSQKFHSTHSKDILLKVAKSLDIDIRFSELGKNNDMVYTLLSLNVDPPQLCIGKSLKGETAKNEAAVEGLKLLFRNGAQDKLFTKLASRMPDKEYLRTVQDFLNTIIYQESEAEKQI